MPEIWPVTIEMESTPNIGGTNIDARTGPDESISPVDIYRSAIVNIDIPVPSAAVVNIDPIVGPVIDAIPRIFPICGYLATATGSGDI